MIVVWRNCSFLQVRVREILTRQMPKAIPEDDLTPVAFVDTDELNEALELTQNLDRSWSSLPKVIPLFQGCRSTDIGDVLQQANGSCFVITSEGFELLEYQQLPYVAVTKKCTTTGKLYEEFPTLDLPNWEEQPVIDDAECRSERIYKELLRWEDGQTRWLLRFCR